LEAQVGKPYRSPVYFRGGSEPYMTISLRARNANVSVAEVNLKFIWDVVSQIKVGEHGQAYVVDGRGRLIAHPDISLVLRNTDLSDLAQVRAARAEPAGSPQSTQLARDTYGRSVLTANAAIEPLDWTTFVELPVDEAYAPLYVLILRISILLLVALLLAFIADLFLARWIVRPLERLERFASRVRKTKDYTLRVERESDDEIGRLAIAFNEMLSELSAARERESSDQFELARVSRLTTMGAMTASIAHEINQPLAAIAANANAGLRWLSRSTPDIEEVHAALKRINNDAHRASEVIQSVRSIFKKAPQQGAAVDVNDVVLEVLALVHGELINYRILVKSDLPRQLPQVRADRVQLQQVILNLITNAVEAMSSVQDRSRVLSVASRTQDPGSVLITVQDTGPGIDPDRRDRIFDAFFSTKASGMGMGLFICRSIIESHGGRLWATAAEPHGAIFHLLLPIGDSGAPDVAAETERTTRPFRGA
jgi:C4-dicarboxylate-specific signal transduction histidine kinase